MPKAGDLPVCPILTLSRESFDTHHTAETNCWDNANIGKSGWQFPWTYMDENEVDYSVRGCGWIYDCCTGVNDVSCWQDMCMMWNDMVEWCGLPSSPPSKYKYAAAAVLVNEYLGNQDLDGNGKVYGYDFHVTGGYEWEKVYFRVDEGAYKKKEDTTKKEEPELKDEVAFSLDGGSVLESEQTEVDETWVIGPDGQMIDSEAFLDLSPEERQDEDGEEDTNRYYFMFRDPVTGIMYPKQRGVLSTKPMVLKNIPCRGVGVSWGEYLRSIDEFDDYEIGGD